MSLCGGCVPWNLPLKMRALYTVDAGPVAMSYENWLLYHMHVTQHQTPEQWAGELGILTAQLLIDPAAKIEPLQKAA